MYKYFQLSFVKAFLILLTSLSFFAALFFAHASSVQARAFLNPQENQSSIGRRIKQVQESKQKKPVIKSLSVNTRTKKTVHKMAAVKPKKLTVPTEVTVYFFTQSPETEVKLNGVSVGMTDNNLRLIAKVNSGAYNVTTRHNGIEITTPNRITVSPESNKFNLTSPYAQTPQPNIINDPPPLNINTSLTNVRETPNLSMEANRAVKAGNAKDVIERYMDPKRTHKVVVEDWQLVYYQSTTDSVDGASNSQLNAQAFFALGQLKLIEGRYVEALEALNKAALILPNSQLAYYGLGNVYLATNQPSQAIRAYEQSIKLDSKFALAYKSLGDAFSKQGKVKEALENYEKAKNLGYRNAEFSYNLGLNMMRQRRWVDALKELEYAANEAPAVETHIAIGDCNRQLDRAMSAANAYGKAIQLNPKSALAHYRLGELLINEREYEQGRGYLEQALVLDEEGRQINRLQVRKLADDAAKKMR